MSETTTTKEFQQRVLADLAAVRADNERLQAEVTGLRSTILQHDGRLRAQEEPEQAGHTPEPRNLSRGQFLRLGGAAAAGAVAAAASGLLHAGPAAAATDGPLVIGQTNHTTNTDTTSLVNGSNTVLASELLRVSNRAGSSITAPTARIAISGFTSGVDSTSHHRVGVYGQSGDFGVVGRQGPSTPAFALFSDCGVLGTAENDRIGVTGRSDGPSAVGAYGRTDDGYGVVGWSDTGISVAAYGGGRIWQALRAAGAPTTGNFFTGEQIRDVNGELWLCVVGGSANTWRRAATVKEGFAGGSVNFLATPVRLFDSRTAAGPPIAPGTNRDVQVAGADVPAGATGVVGNLTVVSTVNSGFLVLFAAGAAPSGTASINWYASGQTLNNMAMSRLSLRLNLGQRRAAGRCRAKPRREPG